MLAKKALHRRQSNIPTQLYTKFEKLRFECENNR